MPKKEINKTENKEEVKENKTKKVVKVLEKKEEVIEPTTNSIVEESEINLNETNCEDLFSPINSTINEVERPYVESKIDEVEEKEVLKTNDEKDIAKNLENSIESITLSHRAKAYLDYIVYKKQTPQEFLNQNPNHKFRKVVEEIIEWQIKTNSLP